MPEIKLRPAQADDAAQICEIYNPFITSTVVTFEEQPLGEPEMAQRIERIQQTYPWIVAERAGQILGYAYGMPWRGRPAYRHTVETAIYLTPQARGTGLGSRLYTALFEELSSQGFRQAIGVITLPNAPSERLHRRLGFQQIGVFPAVGFKFGRWLDVAFWQRPLALEETQ